jgi:hypothetical protein
LQKTLPQEPKPMECRHSSSLARMPKAEIVAIHEPMAELSRETAWLTRCRKRDACFSENSLLDRYWAVSTHLIQHIFPRPDVNHRISHLRALWTCI